MPKIIFVLLFSCGLFACSSNKYSNVPNNFNAEEKGQELVDLSQKILRSVMQREDTRALEKQYDNLSMDILVNALNTDDKKLAFWINTYNAYIQILLLEDPSRFDDRSKFFKKDQINIADLKLSFDEIEHSIIRHSKTKWSGGYIGKIFPPAWEKQLRVSEVDYRIHFALNCGAKSCPAVKIYSAKKLDEGLDKSSEMYLGKTVVHKENLVKLPAIMSWFRADFGGKNGMLDVLKKYNILLESEDPEIEFLSYDWTLDLDNF